MARTTGRSPASRRATCWRCSTTLQSDVQDGDCDHVTGTAEEFSSRVENLPSDVDSDVRNELTKAAAHLDDLAAEPSACTPVETGASGPSGVETTPDTTTTEETTPTTTEETSTTTTTTDEEAPTKPDNSGSGNGQQPEQAPAPPADQGQEGESGDSGGGGVSPPSGGVGAGGGAG